MAEGTTKAPEAGNRFMAYVLLISLALLAVILGTLAWSTYDRLGYVRFVLSLPLPGWLKTWLWGWI